MEYVMLVIIYIVLFVASIFMIIKPEIMWKIEHFLTVKDGEPTDLYILITRLTGILFLFICIITFIIVLVKFIF